MIISDTAGLREDSSDIVEKEGIKRAVNAAKSADILVFVQDATTRDNHETIDNLNDFGIEDDDINPDQVKLNLVNKIDLSNQVLDPSSIGVSGLTGQGMDKFLDELLKIAENLCQTQSGQNCPALTRERHRLHLQKAVEYLEQYMIEESTGSDLVICAHHLRKAVREIGLVSGKVSSDRILDVIFADFCIGK